MRSILALVRRFSTDERGVFAVIFGLLAIVLVAAAGAVVDYTSMEQARTRAQIALDSAALGLAPTIYNDPTTEELMASALAIVTERLGATNTTIDITNAIVDKPNGTLRFTASVTVPMAFVQLIGFPSLTANIMSEATKGSIDIEVAVALDNTGSMSGDMDFLKQALNTLIEIVVADQQVPTYSKMALAPYAAALNVGSYAADVRGAAPAGKSITNLNWAESIMDISGATKANPVVITTATNHGYVTGDIVYINSVSGMTQLNSKFYKVVYKTATTFALQTTAGANVNGTSYSTYSSSSSDKVRKCIITSCEVVASASGHGFQTGDLVRIMDTSSSTFNSKNYTITRRDSGRFSLNDTSSTSTSNPLSSNGNAYCTLYGCEYYYFLRSNGSYATWRITDCVSERMTKTYTEDPPSDTPIGAVYTSNGTCGIAQPITPLTSDKDVLYAQSAAMTDGGNTAGHIGTAWAWYLLSPEFAYLWSAPSRPAAYGTEDLLKVAVLMTDGEYNTQYCNGVVTSTIACSAPDTSLQQARSLCTAMKAKGIIVYTVGFGVTGGSAKSVLDFCATDTAKAFYPKTGADLVRDFAAIGQNITELRLSM